MNWIGYSLLSALAIGICGVVSKKVLFTMHASTFAVSQKLTEVILLLFFLPFISFSHPLQSYIIIIGVSLMISVGYILNIKATRHTELSFAAPFSNITSFFVLLLAFIFLDERLSLFQLGGILLLFLGTFFLEYSLLKKFSFSSLSKYHLYLLISFMLYAISAAVDKKMLASIDILSFLFLVWVCTLLFVSSYHLFVYRSFLLQKAFSENGFFIILSAVLAILSALAYLKAVSLTLVSLVIPVKRLSTLIETILGGSLFHERNFFMRVTACLIMLAGVVFLVL